MKINVQEFIDQELEQTSMRDIVHPAIHSRGKSLLSERGEICENGNIEIPDSEIGAIQKLLQELISEAVKNAIYVGIRP